MGWVEEIGQVRLTDKQVGIVTKIIELAIETDEEDGEEIVKAMIESIDIGMYNLNLMKKELENRGISMGN